MKLWAKLSEIIFKLFARPYIRTFEECSPEKILKQSLKVLDSCAVSCLKDYVKKCQTQTGGFADKAGKPDLYYSLFGYFLAEALGLKELIQSVANYTGNEIRQNNIGGIHLHCAAIISGRLNNDGSQLELLRNKIRNRIKTQMNKQSLYNGFLSLLSLYYTRDYKGLFLLSRQLKVLKEREMLPCPVLAAYLVLQRSFGIPAQDLIKDLLTFYQGNGSFKATQTAPVPDLLSTAVALYALRFAGSDLRIIKPDSLNYTDSLFRDGGFAGNIIDQEPDIEYTFYGLLALGSLAD